MVPGSQDALRLNTAQCLYTASQLTLEQAGPYGHFPSKGTPKFAYFIQSAFCMPNVGGRVEVGCLFYQPCERLEHQLLLSRITHLPSTHPPQLHQLRTSSQPHHTSICRLFLPRHLTLVLQSHRPAKLPATGEESTEVITQEYGVSIQALYNPAEKLKSQLPNWKKTGFSRIQNPSSRRAHCARAPSEEPRMQR